ncbi:MAG TPA: hypothetical protein VH164_14705 [Ktedonobacteraceae bacterium]|nr:hypothetical protein [Ktedonobacteraceae bacterium]
MKLPELGAGGGLESSQLCLLEGKTVVDNAGSASVDGIRGQQQTDVL